MTFSVLVAFYYGNLTHPSQNPPRVGLLSTVPADSGDALREAVQMAAAAGGFFPGTSLRLVLELKCGLIGTTSNVGPGSCWNICSDVYGHWRRTTSNTFTHHPKDE